MYNYIITAVTRLRGCEIGLFSNDISDVLAQKTLGVGQLLTLAGHKTDYLDTTQTLSPFNQYHNK